MAAKKEKWDATLTWEVKGDEELKITLEYKGTKRKTVQAVEKVIAEGMLSLNK